MRNKQQREPPIKDGSFPELAGYPRIQLHATVTSVQVPLQAVISTRDPRSLGPGFPDPSFSFKSTLSSLLHDNCQLRRHQPIHPVSPHFITFSSYHGLHRRRPGQLRAAALHGADNGL